jgi:hypothetical protein
MVRAVEKYPGLLQERLLKILESIGEQNSPVRMLFRRNVAALRSINCHLQREENSCPTESS